MKKQLKYWPLQYQIMGLTIALVVSILIIFGIPEVETVMRFGDIPKPSFEVIISIAFITFG